MIDFHSHFFSRTFFETLAKLSPQDGTVDEKLARVVEKTGLELPDRDDGAHLDRWLSMLDAHGVDHFVSFASAPPEAPVLAAMAERAGGRMTPFAMIDPTADGAAAAAEKLLGAGPFRGLLLFPAMHRYDPSGPEAADVLAVADAHRAVVVVHCGLLLVKLRDLLGLPRGYDLTLADPLRLVPAADAHRNATFVIPHFGAGYLRETLMTGAQCANVCVDSSSSNAWLATQPTPLALAHVFERALGVFGRERVLFGTDSSTLPRGWRADLKRAQEAALAEAGADEATKAAVFDGNARRVLGI